MRPRRIRLALLVLLGLAVPSLLEAQRPLGPPFRVNGPAAGVQGPVDLAMNARGDFVIAWIETQGSSREILARRFAPDGTPVTGEILVARDPADSDPAKVVVADDGSFTVVFPVFPDLVARRYGPDGGFQGESVVARRLQRGQYAAAARRRGGFALVWQKAGLVLTTRIFGSDGEPDGPERRMGPGGSPAIAMGPDGESVVTWLVELPIPNQEHLGDFYLFAQRLGADGRPLGERIAVQGRLRGILALPQVAKDGQGDFLVLWRAGGVLQAGPGVRDLEDGVVARRFAADGMPLTGLLKLTGDRAELPRLAMDRAGNFTVAWYQPGSGLFVRRFTADGTPFRPPLLVDPAASVSLLANDANGNFVVVWQNLSGEILAQRFRKR
jgi:hypothetical protein